ncbi:MAG TPA: hypothetical protein EYH03_07265 [Chromatiales bacterium]|nr:hypothetical protein [Chromatiales bacterium]
MVEIEGGRWHTLCAIEEHTTLFECKPGPYIPLEDKDFVNWAPREGEADCEVFVDWFKHAQPGDLPPNLSNA